MITTLQLRISQIGYGQRVQYCLDLPSSLERLAIWSLSLHT